MSRRSQRSAGRRARAKTAGVAPPAAEPAAEEGIDWMSVLALALYFAWVLAVSLRPVANNDFWLHLKVGQDVLTSGRIADVDTWSATAAGRPYFAHGWLSAVVYALLDRLGPGALTIWRAVLALGTTALMVLALPTRSLRRGFAFPLLVVGTYALAFRFSMRPHLASLTGFALLVLALERWRAQRGWRWIAWLPALFALWANLHGGFLYGLGLLGLFTGGVAGQVALGQRWGSERFAWSDVKRLAAVTALCVLATLLNPFGLRVLLFPITMAEGNAFLKEFISEWGSPFGVPFRERNGYVFAAYLAFLVAAWAPVLATWRRRVPLDLLLLATVSVMSVRANRFLPYVVLAGLPIAARAWAELAAARSWSFARRPWLEGLALGALLWMALRSGFAHGPGNLRPTGWGYGGGMPYEEVARMKELGLDGVVFNELADGALVIHQLGPSVKPVMDARLDVYGRELYEEYRVSREGPEAFLAYLERYEVDYVFLYAQRTGIAGLLTQRADWERLFGSRTHFLFARRR